ncbi:MAG: sodium:alanine symporter family protein [candidate division Zixibacteria bacterium]|nr:sodium:alanine symporter family protein [candidate division Zixibacteria bacterium]
MDQINDILAAISGFVWGWPMAIILLSTGFILTLRMVFIQIRGFAHGVGIVSGKYDDPSHKGELTHFQALSAALSATIGIGNIAGVAIAIYWGGPGAIFWMWVTAFFGMAIKYTECMLAIKHRKVEPDGNILGGPMYYIQIGMHKAFRPLAYMFAFCTALAAFGAGNMVQSNTMAHSILDAFEVSQGNEAIVRWIVGLAVAGLSGAVIIGGIKRIGHVASYLVPFMSIIYVVSAFVIIFINFDEILPAFEMIFYHAFHPTAFVGGSASGATVWLTFTWGLRRGLFSNEAGEGSAPLAHSTAKVEEPVREGLVAMLGPFIDTIIICTMTALVIITTGQWDSGVNGAPLTMHAFNHALPVYGTWMVVVGIILFAFSTVVTWSYYGEKGIEYLAGKKAKLPYKWVFIIFIILGARFDLKTVWSYADAANGLMAVPNLIALVALSGTVVTMTKKYMKEKSQGLHLPFKVQAPSLRKGPNSNRK